MLIRVNRTIDKRRRRLRYRKLQTARKRAKRRVAVSVWIDDKGEEKQSYPEYTNDPQPFYLNLFVKIDA